MKKTLLCAATALLIGVTAVAPVFAEESVSIVDEVDLSKETEKVEKYGIPTPSKVETLFEEADKLFEAGDFEKAAEKYGEAAASANYLANLISQGLEPFYSKRHDDDYDSSYVLPLAKYETMSNDYKDWRNSAFLNEAICYYNMGDYIKALPLLDKALDLISVSDKANWTKAREILYSIIEVQ